tara:strand:- start:3669 stop:6950 length:3282 start_codon:yes stop_codon:yes gene_type:complete
MSFYPLISGNSTVTNGTSQLDLPLNVNDQNFDVLKIKDADDVEYAYLLFVIKNTSSASALTINNISGNDNFNDHFDIDPLEGGQLFMGKGTTNYLKNNDASGLAATNVNGASVAAMTACASGATKVFGSYSTIHDYNLASGAPFAFFNTSQLSFGSGARLRTVYTTASIISNSIPPSSYATFLVKYKPTENFNAQSFLDNPMTLTISNSNNDVVINFSGTASNTLNFIGTIGTAVSGGSEDDSFSAGSEVLTDTGDYDLGLHPIGYVWGPDNKTIKFTDTSELPGNWQYFNSAEGRVGHAAVYGSSPVIDNYTFSSAELGHVNLKKKLVDSLKTKKHDVSLVGDCASEVDGINGQIANIESTAVYKNFELRSGTSIINKRSSHRDWTVNENAADYNHQTAEDCTLKTHLYIKKILNTTSPEDTQDGTNNQAFIYRLITGFYNKLTMSDAAKTLHENNALAPGATDNDWNDNSFNTKLILDQNVQGPWLISNTSGSPMFRDKEVDLAIYLRYNKFNTSNDDDYKVNTVGVDFAKTGDDSLALYHDYTADDTNWHAKKYITAQEPTPFNTDGSEITGTTDSVTYQGWSTSAANGNEIGVLYKIGVTKFVQGHMYDTTISGLSRFVDIINEGKYGVFTSLIKPAYQGDNNIWRKGLGLHNQNSVNYRLNFLPIQSTLDLFPVASNDGYTISINDTNVYTGVTYEPINEYYYPGGSDIISADVGSKSYIAANEATSADMLAHEGDWYGVQGISITRPQIWNGIGARADNGLSSSGYFVHHAPSNNLILTGETGAPMYSEIGATAANLFKMTDATYDTTSSTFKSRGFLQCINTGDYAIAIQSVSIGLSNFTISSNNYQDTYMRTESKMLVPLDGTTNVGAQIKPHTSSNMPTWSAAFVGSNQPAKATYTNVNGAYKAVPSNESLSAAAHPAGVANGHVAGYHTLTEDDDFIEGQQFMKSYFDAWYVDNSPGSADYRKPGFIRPSDDLIGATSGSDNKIVFDFELNPTNVTAQDQGDYYAQIMVTYFVNDYKNRKIPAVDANGNITTENHSLNDYKARLHSTKYLVKVSVVTEGQIEVVDQEGDIAPSIINLPNINLG